MVNAGLIPATIVDSHIALGVVQFCARRAVRHAPRLAIQSTITRSSTASGIGPAVRPTS